MRSKPIPIKAVPSRGSPYRMINFNREGPGIARSNNFRGLLIALSEAQTSDLGPRSLSLGASERALEIYAFSCSCQGNTRRRPGEIVLII